jgi:hypothetical protein
VAPPQRRVGASQLHQFLFDIPFDLNFCKLGKIAKEKKNGAHDVHEARIRKRKTEDKRIT